MDDRAHRADQRSGHDSRLRGQHRGRAFRARLLRALLGTPHWPVDPRSAARCELRPPPAQRPAARGRSRPHCTHRRRRSSASRPQGTQGRRRTGTVQEARPKRGRPTRRMGAAASRRDRIAIDLTCVLGSHHQLRSSPRRRSRDRHPPEPGGCHAPGHPAVSGRGGVLRRAASAAVQPDGPRRGPDPPAAHPCGRGSRSRSIRPLPRRTHPRDGVRRRPGQHAPRGPDPRPPALDPDRSVGAATVYDAA